MSQSYSKNQKSDKRRNAVPANEADGTLSDATVMAKSCQRDVASEQSYHADEMAQVEEQQQRREVEDLAFTSPNSQVINDPSTTPNFTATQPRTLTPQNQLQFWVSDLQHHEHLAYMLEQPTYPQGDRTFHFDQIIPQVEGYQYVGSPQPILVSYDTKISLEEFHYTRENESPSLDEIDLGQGEGGEGRIDRRERVRRSRHRRQRDRK